MENWVNGTIKEINETDLGLYYSKQSTDPIISNCEPTIFKYEVKVFQNYLPTYSLHYKPHFC